MLLSGAPGCSGIVIGATSVYRRKRPKISNVNIDDDQVQQQIERFQQALEKAEQELKRLSENQYDESAKLIRTQIEMLKDPELNKRIKHEIKANNTPADSAIQSVFENYLNVIQETQNEASLERSVDIADVRDRLIQILHDHEDEIVKGTILVAKELSPREVIEFSRQDIKGIIMDHGGTSSHAAIIARSMNIPTVVGLKKATDTISSGDLIIADGRHGEVIVNPRESTQEKYQNLIDQQVETETDFKKICNHPNKTADGHPFVLQANIEFTEELDTVQKYGAEGIGLLRTESIYLSRENFSDQEHQEGFYESILERTGRHPVTIRLFDAGGDKFFKEKSEEQNPFLGWRGIRMLLDEEKLLKSQLRAILHTAARFRGRIRILVPMISTLDELLDVKEMMLNVQGELMKQGVQIDDEVQLGIMVEVPSVAMQADLYAEHADFLSLGTNDLTQYALAVDRGNERISPLYDQRHPAIWKLIAGVADAAQKENIPVSVCGELASDPIAACCLLGLGINKLSMNPVVLPTVKRMLVKHSLEEMQQLSEKVLATKTLEDINQVFSNWKDKNE